MNGAHLLIVFFLAPVLIASAWWLVMLVVEELAREVPLPLCDCGKFRLVEGEPHYERPVVVHTLALCQPVHEWIA